MFVLLTSKPGQYSTEASEHLRPVETYDYLFCGKKRARYVIAELLQETRVRIVDEASPPVVNLVPSKFLPRYASLEAAQRDLAQIAGLRKVDARLVKV